MRVYEGKITKGQKIQIMNTKEEHQVLGLMYPHPISPIKSDEVSTGEIGIWFYRSKSVDGLQVGGYHNRCQKFQTGRSLFPGIWRVAKPFGICWGLFSHKRPD